MSSGAVWLAYAVMLLHKCCFPAAAYLEKQEGIWMEDPSYQIYETYRYAYENYEYLFLTEKMEEVQEPIAIPKTLSLDYDSLMQQYYSVHYSTTASRDLMDAETFLNTNLSLVKSEEPQILIYHTHSQEEFADYGPGNTDATVVGIGAYLTELLEQKGWNVIHDTTTYDMQGGTLDRNEAYTYALAGITEIVEKNPSIQVILDIHRDGVSDHIKLVSEVNGKQTANIMFFQGMCQTPEGPIEGLDNPYLEENLSFAFQMQYMAETLFPDYTRKIYLKGFRYNLHLRPRSSLIEVGAQTNTYEEAKNAMEPLAELLDRVLQGG